MKKHIEKYADIDEIHEDIYDDEYREELMENDKISLAEEAFLRGYEEAY